MGELALAHALQEAQVDQDIDQGIVVGDGGAVAQVRAFNAERQRLGSMSSLDTVGECNSTT
ncbi:MAG: hypothetical protein IT318_05615 [Anaerolineales bacterium]|nr:hypothetical protein [Anaerolineales bacterium]